MAEKTPPEIRIEEVDSLDDGDMADLCEAAETAIIDGGGFGWLKPPPRQTMEAYWRGALLVPERIVFIARFDGRIVGSAQLLLPPRNNEAQRNVATITANFVSPWARGFGLARALTKACEAAARQKGAWFINLDVRETQRAAIQLYESLGYTRWGENPNYAVINGKPVTGFYYTKALRSSRKKSASGKNKKESSK